MAELVDALVSNTNGVTPVPVRLRLWVLGKPSNRKIGRLFYFTPWLNLLLKLSQNIFIQRFITQ